MRRWAAMALALVVAGCTSTGLDLAEIAPTSASGDIVLNPRYGDRDPHDWGARAPATYPVHGTD